MVSVIFSFRLNVFSSRLKLICVVGLAVSSCILFSGEAVLSYTDCFMKSFKSLLSIVFILSAFVCTGQSKKDIFDRK